MNLLKRIDASINSRLVFPWQQNHFEKTRYYKKLLQFKDRYQGKRCFFIGNGPSLQAQDLDILQAHSEITFAFNRIYSIFDDTSWRPSFYISQDEKMLAGCVDIVDSLDLPFKFIPIQLLWYYKIKIHDAFYFNMNWQQDEDPLDYLFSDDVALKVYSSSTGMYTAAQLAAYMGFTQIYLLGVDHHFHISQNNNGEIVIDNSVKDYFTDQYNEDRDKLYIPNTEKSTLTYLAMEKQCKYRSIQVLNATRGGKLEVFPRVDFDSIFK